MKFCNDEVIAVLEVRNGCWNLRRTLKYNTHFVSLDTYKLFSSKYKAPIIIVTESPHIEEFNNVQIIDLVLGTLVDARPVNGKTGANIMNHLVELLKSEGLSFDNGNYPVIVINAIQEQCSLGKDTKLYRTENFITRWENNRHILQSRLGSIIPILTINACTAGDFYIKNGESAFQQNNRSIFEQHFLNLIENKIGYKTHHNNTYQNIIEMHGSIDLAGMVMSIIENVYSSTCRIEKTTHPSFWSNTAPKFQRKNGNTFTLYK
ncbi:hypothetical protein [Aeromonas hydrophila]|uniref:hypothetical protein n=1 Tax=Aeromonas hydrophila TaxID=644 RepID=UPI001A8F0B33|nr:hypothetical protein [Aeromonas hydrophila]MBQ4666664.1 hypothetical protein [Aeromonas hydrophila]MBQ4714973.1 hypothetical protein [Aeromonas hydrophila]MBW3823389.1 hypothetical protein [Aeromonas hydrophila]MBW5268380.1 hypothetical protein [Aeromonas hydrophila]QSR51719.1 hypothetical protein GO458_10430 [Aeromonas hydrophila]